MIRLHFSALAALLAFAPVVSVRAQDAAADWSRTYALVLDRNWTAAEPALAEFLDRHPADANASAARFWTCFAHEQRERFPAAYDCYRAQAQATPTDRWTIEARTRLVAVAARLPNESVRALTTAYGVARPSVASAPRPSAAIVASGASQPGSFVVYGPSAARDTVWLAREPMRYRTIVNGAPAAAEIHELEAYGVSTYAPSFETAWEWGAARTDTLPSDERVAVLAIEALGRSGANESVADLRELSESGSTPAIRGAALGALGRIGTPEAASALMEAVRRVDALPASGYASVVAALARLAAERPETPGLVGELERIARRPGVRAGAVAALGRIDTDAARSALMRLTADTALDADIRRAAVQGLGRRATAQTVPALARIARDPEATVARAAVDALSRIDAPEARQALLDLARMRR